MIESPRLKFKNLLHSGIYAIICLLKYVNIETLKYQILLQEGVNNEQNRI